jgi:catechol 2,3-dioxygenase-like lactoylglutathione lyase family enzyme
MTEERRETEQTESLDVNAPAPATTPAGPAVPPRYWIRVHGYVSDLQREVAYYHDFFDMRTGKLPSDPAQNLRAGDVIVFYADGPGVLYGTGTVTGDVDGPRRDPRQGRVWDIPVLKGALVKDVSKGPHIISLEPPSGLRFHRYVRDYTYIRVPDEDGPYFVEQVKIRAGGKD